ncbi:MULTISPECIES: RagB/SusD family nutrient uptake outer membrane protein [unclassified Sphingobacterium]|uniref:RagB/SusD family nutrient uptake outer membrane protein n=1 Tax=unclassified Sphingobacterium TaxID=2609468 RepID=UPI0025F30287|nr:MULTISPECIES: RagB/SusD family nutrient uptake outer membrane protein [unclassified Sphingobacterium]
MKIFIFLIALTSIIYSCQNSKFLDDKTVGISAEDVFTDSVRTLGFLNRIYQDMGYSFDSYRFSAAGGSGNMELATDNAEGNNNVSVWGNAYAQGVIAPSNVLTGFAANKDLWNTPYTNIRRVNLLLTKLPNAPFTPATRTRMVAEARFLRAFYYYNMVAAFGGIPLVGDRVFEINDLIDLPRNTFEESINYIVQELDAAAATLASVVYRDIDFGRITNGACLALKSRVLLYAASPLFNGGLSSEATAELSALVGYPNYDKNRWQNAATAAEAVISSHKYALNVDNETRPGNGFYQVFLKRINSEYILAYNRTTQKELEAYYLPPTRSGSSVMKPTHNLVAAFPMRDGKPTHESTLYDPNNPYANRDPRFDYSIIYNGLSYVSNTGPKTTIYTYMSNGSNPANPTNDAYTPNNYSTGYYSRKMLDENLATNTAGSTERGWPLIRYAEILLNYAEAINEAGFPERAYDKLKELRERAGIFPGSDRMYGLKVGMNVEQMRIVIQNERRIELAFEDHRFNDIRRWMIAENVLKGFNKTIIITRNGNTFTYLVGSALRPLNFRKAMYLLPIPLSEIQKMPLMRQNPGY